MLEKMDAPRAQKCPACGGEDSLLRLVSAAGFRLKGSGWYQTDFKNSGRKKPAAAKGEAEAKDKGKQEKTDAQSKAGTDESAKQKDAKPKGSAPPA